MSLVSSIYRQGPAEHRTPARERNREIYSRLWHERGVVAVDPNDITDDWIKQAFKNEAEKQYGRRHHGQG